MKGLDMEIDWCTIQIFLSDEGVCEVQGEFLKPGKMRCTCPNYQKFTRCKHTKRVKQLVAENNGNYSIVIPEEVSDDEVLLALNSSDAFHKFIVKHSPIEVL